MSEPPVVKVTLGQMLEAMAHLPDETVFRWYQKSHFDPHTHQICADETLCLTLGELRRTIAAEKPETP